MRKAYPWSAEHSRALARRCEDTRFFAPLFQSGLRHGVLIQKDEQAVHVGWIISTRLSWVR